MPIPSRTARSRLSATFAAVALALTSLAASATPARASDDAMIKLLLGAAAVAIIASGAAQSRATTHAPRHPHTRPQPYHAPRGYHAGPKHRARYLPQHCATSFRAGGKHHHAYSARCLHHAGLRNLPHQCHETVRTNHGMRSVYRARCLERHASPRAAPARALPDWCATSYQCHGRWHRGYSASCLRQAGFHQLPATCLVSGRSFRRVVSKGTLPGVGNALSASRETGRDPAVR